MKKIKNFVLALGVIAVSLATLVVAQAEVKPITDYINRIANYISIIGGSVATLMLIITGIQAIMSKDDPAERERLVARIKYIIIGLAVIVLAPQIVKLFTP